MSQAEWRGAFCRCDVRSGCCNRFWGIREIEYTSAQQSVVTKVFCPTCGSPILGKNTGSPDHVTLTLGTMDDAGDLKVGVVIFERDAPHWDTLGDDVMRFATQPDWSPDPERAIMLLISHGGIGSFRL